MRVDKEPAFILHRRPYRESSAILEVFTPVYGRVGLVHRGACRSTKTGNVMQAFNELALSWAGKGELFTLTKSDVLVVHPINIPERVICGLYLNELILSMIPRLAPSPDLYRCYAQTVSTLNHCEDIELLLRKFEMNLLYNAGYALQLEHEAESQTAIEAEAYYQYDCTRGPIRCSSASDNDVEDRLSGRTLIWLRSLRRSDQLAMREAKRLLRKVLDYHLQNKPLHTRTIMKYMHRQ